jgi:hypothetical protein
LSSNSTERISVPSGEATAIWSAGTDQPRDKARTVTSMLREQPESDGGDVRREMIKVFAEQLMTAEYVAASTNLAVH